MTGLLLLMVLQSSQGVLGDIGRQLPADTTLATESGATFVAPKGWWIRRGTMSLVLEEPARHLKAILLETPEPDALKAIADGWQRVLPGFALPLEPHLDRPPPSRGWQAVTNVAYQTRTGDQRVVSAMARRFGGTTYLALVDGDKATHARRWPQLHMALWTLQPTGMHEESFKGQRPRNIDDARARALDLFVGQALARLDVPGAAVAVIKGRQVVYERSFGRRALGKQDPVTPRTLFMMGSITKPMTTMMEATLVDSGQFGWDTRVTTLLPTFALGDPIFTRKLRIWHTACACTGMPQQDLEAIFEFAAVTPEERLASMKTMKPTTALGETFQYSNLMVAAGGYAAAHAQDPRRSFGEAYAGVMRRNVFGPIGMNATTLDFAEAERGDHALPHALDIDGVVRAIPVAMEKTVVTIAPAGAVWSNLHDMERYVMTEMANGVSPDGNRVVSEKNLSERRKSRVRAGADAAYGLGVDIGTFHDLPMFGHTGGLFGYGTTMFVLPDQELAIIILTNVRNGGDYETFPFNAAVKRRIIEELFDGARDISGTMVTYFADTRRDLAAKAVDTIERDPEPEWVRTLAGAYVNSSLGRVQIAPAARGGTFDAGEWKMNFARRRRDATTKLVLVDAPFAGGEIIVSGSGARTKLTIKYGQATYVFERARR